MENKQPFESEHILLRPFEPEDIPALQAYLNQPGLAGRRYIPSGFPDEAPLSAQQAQAVLSKWEQEGSGLVLAVTLKDSGVVIGHAVCDWGWDPHSPFTAVVIAPDRQRWGFGSEVLGLLLHYLFGSTPAHNVSSWMADWNTPALAFALKHGFREGGRSRREGLRAGKYYDEILVDLLRPEWKS